MNLTMTRLAPLLCLCLLACGKPAAENAVADAQHDDSATEHDASLHLTREQIAAAALTIETAAPASLRETVPLYGIVAPNAERVRDVVARYPGVIRSVARTTGDTVRQGETLATVESDESLQTYAVTAPIAGVISARDANAGEQSGDRLLFTIADLSTVWVELSVFPRDVGKLRVGQPVHVTDSAATHAADGRLIYLAAFGSRNQTVAARVLLDNADRRWAPGLYVSAALTLSETASALAVRNEAIQTLDGRSVVFVVQGERFTARTIRTGRRDAQFTEVLDGLSAGERYVSRNSYILKAELGKDAAGHEH